jgi:hypothetical protein
MRGWAAQYTYLGSAELTRNKGASAISVVNDYRALALSIGKFSFSANGKAVGPGYTAGFIKVITNKARGEMLEARRCISSRLLKRGRNFEHAHLPE